MPEFDNNLQVIVSKVTSSKQNAPTLRVTVEINGTKYQAGLWPWRRKDGSAVNDKNGNMQYIGKLEVDDYKPQGQPAQPPTDDFEDSIPFNQVAA